MFLLDSSEIKRRDFAATLDFLLGKRLSSVLEGISSSQIEKTQTFLIKLFQNIHL